MSPRPISSVESTPRPRMWLGGDLAETMIPIITFLLTTPEKPTDELSDRHGLLKSAPEHHSTATHSSAAVGSSKERI